MRTTFLRLDQAQAVASNWHKYPDWGRSLTRIQAWSLNNTKESILKVVDVEHVGGFFWGLPSASLPFVIWIDGLGM